MRVERLVGLCPKNVRGAHVSFVPGVQGRPQASAGGCEWRLLGNSSQFSNIIVKGWGSPLDLDAPEEGSEEEQRFGPGREARDRRQRVPPANKPEDAAGERGALLVRFRRQRLRARDLTGRRGSAALPSAGVHLE
uniref:Uncharacterized protein n=1 Tax=Knipowitschia caucasica TaxID=637954 RepID=A0AAV2K856_KNICA